ncbi:MAG: hypothetical protein ABS69_20020 [Nitrosomonadales bacterium SCN 54-20]|nr:MAG: hypothetical protein ABS69_20020 [Nitrosomonadales bacterium SCN 54-20]
MDLNIKILGDLVQVIGAAGDAISKFVEGFKNIVISGKDAYEHVAAKRQRARLIDISRRATIVRFHYNAPYVETLKEYLSLRDPSDTDWAFVRKNILSTLSAVQDLLTDVQAEKSDLVLESAYSTLNETLAARSFLLHQLAQMPAPSSEEEREFLRQAMSKYQILISNLHQAIDMLNSYIKDKK